MRRGQRRQKRSSILEARRIQPAALWSQDPAARTVVLCGAVSKEKIQRRAGHQCQKRVFFSDIINSAGDGTAEPQAQFLKQIIKDRRDKNTTERKFFRARNPSTEGKWSSLRGRWVLYNIGIF